MRVYLPPDANTLLSTYDHCLRSRDYVNVVVAGKQPGAELPDHGPGDRALHARPGHLGVGRHRGRAARSRTSCWRCAGDVPTLEVLAAADILRREICRTLKVRVVNVVDLMRLQDETRAPARAVRPRVRHAVHRRQADHLRLPRLPVADPPPDLPPQRARQPARARVQGGGHHHHALRHGHAQRPRPLPPGDRRHRPRALAAVRRRRTCASRWSTRGSGPGSTPGRTARTSPRCATGCGRAPRAVTTEVSAAAATGGDNE